MTKESKGEIVEAEIKEETVDAPAEKTEESVKEEIVVEEPENNPEDKPDIEPKQQSASPVTSGKPSSKAAIALSACALVLGGVGCGLGFMAYQKTGAPITFLGGSDGNSANFTEGSIADIANKVSKSVVSIVTSTKSMNLFGQSTDSQAAGTGIIVTKDGYIITNKHVISGANKVTVILDDGTTYEDVEVVATDPLNDVAYLKIKDIDNLTPATLGDSKTITIGQQVIAIGNALGEYQNTVTAGIISGTGRSVTASDGTGSNVETLTDMIQTDAAINSGNSGGPLVNAAGEVIGINTATSATAENMGFAIPISSTKGMLNQLIETGKAKRTYLGVHSAAITPSAAEEYNLPVKYGAYLYSPQSYSAIVKDSPAAKAGLKDKDIVTAVNGTKVGVAGSLADLIGEYKPGDTVQLTVLREGKEMTVNVTLEGYSDK